nr:hypothetical protein [Nonlabens spongiae]
MSYGHGLLWKRLLQVQRIEFTLICFLGLFGIQVVSTVWSFFYDLSLVWSIFLILTALSGYTIRLVNGSSETFFLSQYLAFSKTIFSTIPIVIFALVGLSIAYVSSGAPYFIDNDSYYIQTIKWLDEYGLVKGLSNLHPFLSQQSGFHILQSALNFDYFYSRFNDLSGVYLLLGFLWSLSGSRDWNPSEVYRKSFAVLFGLGYLFASAPSPDLPVFVLTYIVIYYFLRLYDKYDRHLWSLLTCLILQVILFKVIAALLILLPVILIARSKFWKSKSVVVAISLGLLFAIFYIAKSYVVSGLPLYPLTAWSPLEPDWQWPQELADLYTKLTESQSYGVYYKNLSDLSFWGKFQLWVNHAGMEGWFNKLTLFCLILQVLALFLPRIPGKIKWILSICLLQSAILFLTAPQFRFFAGILIPSTLLGIIHCVKPHRWVVVSTVSTAIIAGFVFAVLGTLRNPFTDNALMRNDTVETSHFVSPLPNARKEVDGVLRFRDPDSYRDGLKHHHAENEDFIFATYDLPLPAAQTELLDWIENEYNIKVVQRSEDLKDGFKVIYINR